MEVVICKPWQELHSNWITDQLQLMNTAGVLLHFPPRQRAAFSWELFLSGFCQKSTGAFIETNCLWAQLSAIDKLIMQMRDIAASKNHTQTSELHGYGLPRASEAARRESHAPMCRHRTTWSPAFKRRTRRAIPTCRSAVVGRSCGKWYIKSEKSFLIWIIGVSMVTKSS